MTRSLAILFTIANRTDRDRFISFYQQEGVSVGLQFLGQGTASREILSFLGIGETDKVILMGVLSQSKAQRVTHSLDIALKMNKLGAIAFTIPLHSLGARHMMEALFGNCISESEVETMEPHEDSHPLDDNQPEAHILYELIIVIANKGFVGLIMEAARTAGATGGTTIHAGGTRDARTDIFHKLAIHNEKDVVWILVDADKRVRVMKAIMENAGAEANAVLFSIPVTDTAGMPKH